MGFVFGLTLIGERVHWIGNVIFYCSVSHTRVAALQIWMTSHGCSKNPMQCGVNCTLLRLRNGPTSFHKDRGIPSFCIQNIGSMGFFHWYKT